MAKLFAIEPAQILPVAGLALVHGIVAAKRLVGNAPVVRASAHGEQNYGKEKQGSSKVPLVAQESPSGKLGHDGKTLSRVMKLSKFFPPRIITV